MKKNRFILFSISIISALLILTSCQTTYHATPHEALTDFPGYLTQDNLPMTTFQQELVAGGLVLLYRYQPDPTDNEVCLASTFVTHDWHGWQAQSSSKLACASNLFDKFRAGYTVGGNITELTTAYGISTEGSQVRIQWSDGTESIVPVENNYFLKSRPAYLHVTQIELIDDDNTILDSINWSE
ncbi:MAG: hypothetical protein DWQ04_10515 [Chloroflexi bacterium]|nr:MAG: hypothetical protein DWQ04_10515 [Chloroflexota bacterium]